MEAHTTVVRLDASHGEEARLGAATGVVAAGMLLSACGGGDGGSSSTPATTSTPVTSGKTIALDTSGFTALASVTDAQAARFLLQVGLAATDADIASVRSLGYAGWIQAEVAKSSGISGWDWLNAKGYGDVNSTANYYDNSYPGDYMIWSQLMTAPDPMRKRAALALSELLVVSLSSLDFSWRSHAIAQYWDVLCTHAFGNFRDLLEAITLNPAMGFYLKATLNKSPL